MITVNYKLCPNSFKKYFLIIIAAIVAFSPQHIYSQTNSLYMAPIFKKAYDKGTRSYNGLPGNNYWMNNSEYNIKASLDFNKRTLDGSEEITYFNNSPDTLKVLVVKLLQNVYKKGAGHSGVLRDEQITDGVNVSNLKINDKEWDLNNNKATTVFGTNMILRLQPGDFVAPNSKIKLNINWNYELARNGYREGVFTDSSYFVGYWYPQMAVYDDYKGWDVTNYTADQEMYNDLSNYNVEITLPANYLVWATGDLTNEKEIYSLPVLDKINASRKSKDVIKIIDSVAYKNKILISTGNVTWRYAAKNVPDFSWATSSYYLWDACSASSDEKNNKTVWVNALYPPTAGEFKKVAGWAKKSVEYFSNFYPAIPFPYDKHFTFNGHRLIAMEYPMMANNRDGGDALESYVFELTAHEIAHSYLPFYTLSNEEEFGWMDEGFTKFFGELALDDKGVKRCESKYLNTIQIYKNLAGTLYDVPLITTTTSINPLYDFPISYAKSSTALYYLREIMEEKGINNSFKQFIEAWKDKHPIPYDFFFFFNKLAGEDLSWFWKPWYFEYASPDLSLKEVNQKSNSAEIVIENIGGIPSPVRIEITYDDNSTLKIKKSAAVWRNTNIYKETFPISKKIISVTLGDPLIVDINPRNDKVKLIK